MRLLFSIVLLLILFAPRAYAGAAGLWRADTGEYWLLQDKTDGSALAVQINTDVSTYTVWWGSVTDNKISLTQIWPGSGSFSAVMAQNRLSGSYETGGKQQNFTADIPYTYLGSGVDGAYSSSIPGRYYVFVTFLVNNAATPVLIELSLNSGGLEIYTGTFSVPAADIVQFSGKGMKGGDITISIASSGITGSLTLSGNNSSFTAAQMFSPSLIETGQDYLGYYKTSPNYAVVSAKGIKVVNLPEEESYAVFWQPSQIQQGRIMLAVHGTDGTPYAGINDEIDLGTRYGYTVLGVQWHNQRTDNYYSATQLYRIIHKALQYAKERYGLDLQRIAYVGFSRGAAVSYETTYLDLKGYNYFDLTISASGGIPINSGVSPGEDNGPGVFFYNLVNNKLGSQPLAGSNFFLYCGEKDEEWGAEMCQQVDYAKTQIEKNGGTVVEFIRDANGTHGGYRLNESYHERGVNQFLSLTP